MTRVVDADGRVANVIDKIDRSRRRNSPSQNLILKVEGGILAIAIALIALGGVLVAAILLPQITRSQSDAAVAVALRPISAQVASAQDRAWLAERDTAINAEQMRELRVELAKRGIHVTVTGH